jgi:hypothetical protein
MDNWQRATVKVRSIVWCKEVEPDPGEMAARYGARDRCSRLARAAGLLPLRQPAGRCGGASEMRPQPVTAAAYHVPADRPLLISRCCANRGGLVVPNASQLPSRPLQ